MSLSTTKSITLDLYHNKHVVVEVVQYDVNSRELIITLTNKGQAYKIEDGITVRLKYLKSDGKKSFEDCEVLSGGTVKIIFTENMTASVGRSNAELMLIEASTGNVLHAMPFVVHVIASVFSNEEIESTDEFSALTNALLTVDGLQDRITNVEESLSNVGESDDNVLFVDKSIEQYENISEAINACINEGILQGKEVVFTSGKTYELSSPIVINNITNTRKSIMINFNNALITSSVEMDYLVYVYAGSNNGIVTHYINNLKADASTCNYGLYLDKSIRMRMQNIDIRNGLTEAIHIESGIETFIDKFSLWRTESANTTNPDSVGINCQATDCYFSNGVVVNYKVACKSGKGVNWSAIHSWWYFTDDEQYNIYEENNKAVMMESVCFEVEGQNVISNCEFDACSICVKVLDSLDAKSPVMIDNCMLVLPPHYYNNGSPRPYVIHVGSGNGSNITLTNFSHYQSYPYYTYLCNLKNNKINYDYTEKALLNLPLKDKVYTNAAGIVSGETIQLEATEISIQNEPSYVVVANHNMFPITKNIGIINGITAWKDDDNTIHLRGTAETTFNMYLAGTWESITPIMLFKKGITYCISRPNHDGISLGFLNNDTVFLQVVGVKGNPYQAYNRGTQDEIEVTGIFLHITEGTVFDDLEFKPFININPTPLEYEKGKVAIVTDYTNTISCDGYTYLTVPSGETLEVRYKNGDVIDSTDLQLIYARLEALESQLA